MNHAILYAVGLCLLALAGEAYAAGGNIRHRLSMLQKPRYSPPLWGWVIIGGFYYVMCGMVLYRLFLLYPKLPFRTTAVWLLVAMMLLNAVWNWFFFRRRDLGRAFLLTLPYTALALVLFCLLLRIDRTAAIWLTPYLLYLVFANLWGYSIWKLNN